jgi:DNA-binding LacI/PurR family transcriptional regulator
VRIDLFSATRAAVRHLLASGRRRIAFLAPGHEPGSSRADAYRAVLVEAGLAPMFIDVPPAEGFSERARTRQAVRGVLRRRQRPDALFCFNDEYAIGALRGLRDAGLSVPDDVAIFGCDGIEETEYHDPPLSTIVFPFTEAARLGWEFLRQRIEDPGLPVQSAVLIPDLAVRESSGVVHGDTPKRKSARRATRHVDHQGQRLNRESPCGARLPHCSADPKQPARARALRFRAERRHDARVHSYT